MPEQLHARPSPRDIFVTVYGRKPVLEALADPGLAVHKVVVAEGTRGASLTEILEAARRRDVPVHRASAHRVKVLAGNGRHDQGVLADVVAPRMRLLADMLATRPRRASVLVLDRITTPANVGMILRTATAAGLDGIVLPRRGVPAIDPLVVKASAGVAFSAPVLRCGTAEEAGERLRSAGFTLLGLTGSARGSECLFDADLPELAGYVLGNETSGVSEPVRRQVAGWLSIPMSGGVDSLNVASAAAVLCFELVRRRLSSGEHRPHHRPQRRKD